VAVAEETVKTWVEHHRESERLVSEAEASVRSGDIPQAQALYAQAADAEEAALIALDHARTRTLGICVVSIVSLRCKASQLTLAETTAHHWLASGRMPDFAAAQLRDLRSAIRRCGVEAVE
jgi:hypothetical protein